MILKVNADMSTATEFPLMATDVFPASGAAASPDPQAGGAVAIDAVGSSDYPLGVDQGASAEAGAVR